MVAAGKLTNENGSLMLDGLLSGETLLGSVCNDDDATGWGVGVGFS